MIKNKRDMKQLQCNFTTPEQSKRLLWLGVPAWTADCVYSKSGKIEIKNTALDTLYPSCWSVGRLIEIFTECSNYNALSMTSAAHETYIEQLIELYEKLIDSIDFKKLEQHTHTHTHTSA